MLLRSRATTAALLAAAVVGGALAGPGAAAPSPFVVYELRRAGGGGSEVQVRIEGRPVGGPGLYVHTQLRPTATGYDARGFGIVQYSDPGTETRTYGWPVAAEPCATVPLCTGPATPGKITSVRTFRPARGDRIFIVGVRGQVTVTPLTRGWSARPATLGFRVVTADRADTTGAYVAGAHVEHFRAATAPGGARGSIAFADVPCDAGSAVLASDAGERRTFDCRSGFGMAAEETVRGRRWTVEGDTFGSHGLPFRLVVLDYPAGPPRAQHPRVD